MPAEDLISSPGFFPSLINAMPDGFLLRAVDGTVIEVNASFCHMIGFDRDDVIGSKPPHPWWADEERENIGQLATRYFAGDSSDDDMIFKRKSGERFPAAVTSAPIRDSRGQIVAYVGTVKDMTERKRQQRELAFQARLIDRLQAAVIATDEDGVITLWNRGAEDLYGWSASDVIGVDVRNVLPGVGSAAMASGSPDRLRHDTATEGEYSARHRDGSTFPVFVTEAPIHDQEGSLTGIVAVSVSIADRRRSEQRRNAQYEVARVLADADNLASGMHNVLAAVGSSLGWSFGAFWSLDDQQQIMRCLDVWKASDLGNRELQPGLTGDWSYRDGGVLRRTWQTGEPVWVADVLEPSDFLRAQEAWDSGFQSWIAFPIVGRHGVFGAVEFFSRQKRVPEPELLALLTSFGRQIGHFVERKRAESALRESEDRFRAMADSAPVLLWLADRDGSATWFNRGWLAFRGRTLEDELGNGWMEGVHPSDFDRSVSGYEAALCAREPYTLEYRMKRHDSSYRWLLSSGAPRIAPDGSFEGFVGSCVDITDRKRVEEEQRFLSEATRILASSLDYQANLTSLADLVANRLADWCFITVQDVDAESQISIVAHRDPEQARIARDMLGHYALDFDARAPDRPDDMVQAAVYSHIDELQLAAIARDADHLRILRDMELESAMVVPLVARERTLGAITFISGREGRHFEQADLDLAEHLGRRASIAIDNALLYEEARLATRQRDQFLAVAAHELRSPLTSMKGFAQLLLRRAERDPLRDDWVRPLRMIDDQANRLSGLMSRLLDVSRIEEDHLHLEFEQVDLAEIVRAAVAEVSLATETHAIDLVVTTQPLIAEVDRSRIVQVLTNLLDNAVKYSPDASSVDVRASRDGDAVVVSVTDYGVGIDEDAQHRLFERFFRGRRSSRGSSEGLGLGLYVSRGIIEAHGGSIDVVSRPGQGSTFTIAIPSRQPIQAASET